MKKTITIILITILFGISYVVTVRLLSLEASYAESNYYRNLMKIESLFDYKSVDIALVGSSISDRVKPILNNGNSFINLGINGGSPASGLILLENSKIIPKIIFVEIYGSTLLDPNDNDIIITEQMTKINKLLWQFLPITRPSYRPSSVLYSLLKKVKESPIEKKLLTNQLLSKDEVIDMKIRCAKVSDSDAYNPTTVLRMLKIFKDRGSEVYFIYIPHGLDKSFDTYSQNICPAIQYLGTTAYNLEIQTKKNGVPITYTDGLHLDRGSATLVSNIFAKLLQTKINEITKY